MKTRPTSDMLVLQANDYVDKIQQALCEENGLSATKFHSYETDILFRQTKMALK